MTVVKNKGCEIPFILLWIWDRIYNTCLQVPFCQHILGRIHQPSRKSPENQKQHEIDVFSITFLFLQIS